MASDPSSVVNSRLLPHLHLLCIHRYPVQLQPLLFPTVRDYLLQAAQLVKDHVPVAWTYLKKPLNGTIMLAWQPPTLQGSFATDGYVWTTNDKAFNQSHDGFQIDMFVSEAGFDPATENTTLHRRTRYRLSRAPPNTPFDPNLEIVHYIEALPNHKHPVSRQHLSSAVTQKQLQSREVLERQGLPARVEFMLHDSSRWQRIEPLRQSMQGSAFPPGPYGRQMPQAVRGPGPQPGFITNQGTGLPPTAAGGRRVNEQARAAMAAANQPLGAGPRNNDAILDDEDNVLGDYIDFLNPYEISVTRFKQHHEWMEEILSSPYHDAQLRPVELGLRLTGELGKLTAGLFDSGSLNTQPLAIAKAPPRDAVLDSKYAEQADRGFRELHPNPHELSSFEIAEYEPIDEAKLKELEKRVAEFLKKGEEQVSAMKKNHSQKMDELKREKMFAALERRLAEEPNEDGNDGRVGLIMQEAELNTDATIIPHQRTACIEKGGIITAAEQALANIDDAKSNAEEMVDVGNEQESANPLGESNGLEEIGESDVQEARAEQQDAAVKHVPGHESVGAAGTPMGGYEDNYSNMDTEGEGLQFLDHENDNMDYTT